MIKIISSKALYSFPSFLIGRLLCDLQHLGLVSWLLCLWSNQKLWINICVVTKLLTSPKLGIIRKKTKHSISDSCKSPVVDLDFGKEGVRPNGSRMFTKSRLGVAGGPEEGRSTGWGWATPSCTCQLLLGGLLHDEWVMASVGLLLH